MGVKQSKRSVDITETSTKGEIEGFGNEGKVEKIVDGVVEKVAANGHVEGDLQNGIEPLQNGVEPMQNGEAAAVATEKINKDDEPPVEVVNGQVENGEVNEDEEKSEEAKKSEEKKEKKKEKKEKAVKKKFSLRNFSFSKRDKTKPPKEEKSPEKLDETAVEEALAGSEKDSASPSQAQLTETPKPEESKNLNADSSISVISNTVAEQVQETVAPAPTAELSSKITAGSEDLPPPLPASPPPSEPIEGKLVSGMDKLDLSEPASENPSGEIDEVTSSVSSVLTVKMESFSEAIKDAEQMAMETGQQIEEKATSLLKTVEERAEEGMRTAGELISQKTDEMQETCQNELGLGMEKIEAKEDLVLDDAKKLEEGVPVEMSSIGSLSPKLDEPADKHEEGAGESLAEISKDLTDEVTAVAATASNPDSLEIPSVPPPPAVESVTGE